MQTQRFTAPPYQRCIVLNLIHSRKQIKFNACVRESQKWYYKLSKINNLHVCNNLILIWHVILFVSHSLLNVTSLFLCLSIELIDIFMGV